MKASPPASVLVIDDEASIRESFRFFLEDLNCTVIEAAPSLID
jgi:CheY-like chemotaxis protein